MLERMLQRLVMKPPVCQTCGKAEWNHTCRGSRAAPDPPRSNAPPPNPRKPRTDPAFPRTAIPDPTTTSIEPTEQPAQNPRKPDTAPSLPPPNLKILPDDTFRALYSRVQAEYQRRRRAKKLAGLPNHPKTK